MQLAARVQIYLDRQRTPYALIPHEPTLTLGEAAAATHIDPQRLARAVLLQDEKGLLLVILPATYLIDFRAIHKNLAVFAFQQPRIRLPLFSMIAN